MDNNKFITENRQYMYKLKNPRCRANDGNNYMDIFLW